MKKEKVTGGETVLGQVLLLSFFIPFSLLITYTIVSKNLTQEGFIFLAIFLVAIFLIVRFILSFADIYVGENVIIVRRVFSKKERPLLEIQRINRTTFFSLPYTF